MSPLSSAFQEPAQAPAGAAAAVPQAAGGFWSGLVDLVREPGVVEVLLAAILVAAVAVFWWRISRLVRGSKSRQALQDYLFGIEQALHGDLQGAHERLQKVLAEDPENHFARLMLGKVLAELGEPEQAHQQHLYLQRAFGIDSAENDLLLAQSLLGAGMAHEAADAAERALQRLPERAAGYEFVYRARLQTGDFEAAALAGKRLLDLVRDGDANRRWRAEVGRTIAHAGIAKLRRGDGAGAEAALQQARRIDANSDSAPLLAARLEAHQRGLDATVRALLAVPAEAAPQAGALIAVRTSSAVVTAPGGLPMATFAGLVPSSRWQCGKCAAPLSGRLVECPRCQSRDTADLLEPGLLAAVDSPTHTMDAVDENVAHVQRLVRLALDPKAETMARATSRTELLHLRERAVEELLRQAWQRSDDGREAAIELLRAMGPSIAPVLFAASDALEQQRILPIGSRSPAAVVGRIVQGFDRTALPHVESLFASAKPEHRKILIDYFLGLADLGDFQIVLERFPPMEILHRFNKADGTVLRRFLQALPPGHFVAESLLLESTFYREDEVLAAIPGARHPEVLERTLLQRGPTRTLTKALIAGLADAEIAATATKLLGALGDRVLDHVLAAFTDPERGPEERARLGRLLANGGVPAVERLCSSFGPEPTQLDDELRAVLASIGDRAIAPLQSAYEHSGWLEKVSLGMVTRHTNRRVQIVRTLQAISSPAATAALRLLVEHERDSNLRLRLQQALHELGTATGGNHG
ncbi:MAG: tetratricopeptide repeat protein [Planctomycetes bacterium]|nr:tetratricopeptide repeat protein [Planctomycetota bacterium]